MWNFLEWLLPCLVILVPLLLGLVFLFRRRHAPGPALPPEVLNPPNIYLGFWRRFLALVLDSCAQWCLMLVLILVLVILGEQGNMTFFLMVACGVDPLYCILFWKNAGATPGKMVMKIRVARPSGKPLMWNNVLWRALPKIIWSVFLFVWLDQTYTQASQYHLSQKEFGDLFEAKAGEVNMIFYGIFGVDALVFFFNKRNRALHDLLGGTVVVRAEK